ncbi:hypothetical protein GFS31_32040 [Leptolyngbya sp. BL0902]|nr:hypothetical protein GFS31_32040 [Leptolyngbya sp. BL0902]
MAGAGRKHGKTPAFCSDNYIFTDVGWERWLQLQIFAKPRVLPRLGGLAPGVFWAA